MISISRSTAIIALISAIALPIAGAAVMQYRVGQAEKRIEKLEDNVKWQNDVLWEIRSDIKVMKEREARP